MFVGWIHADATRFIHMQIEDFLRGLKAWSLIDYFLLIVVAQFMHTLNIVMN